jgi:sodium transport system permease protein
MSIESNTTQVHKDWRAWVAVVRKEWRDAWADKRGTQSAMMYALLGPVLVFMVLSTLVQQSRNRDAYPVAIVNQHHWQELTKQMNHEHLRWQPFSLEQAQAQLKARNVAAILQINADSAAHMQSGSAVALTLWHRQDERSLAAMRLLRAQIGVISQRLSDARLYARGIAPALVNPVAVNVHNIDGTNPRSSLFSMLAIVLLLGAFFAGMNVAIDATAGERERESLEVLLSQPPSYLTMIFGKYAVVLAFSLIGSFLTLGIGWLLLSRLDLYQLPMQLPLDALSWLKLALLCLPFALLMSGLQMVFALLAKNYKEAQIYLTLLAFVPALMSLPLAERIPENWPIPVLSEHRMMQAVLRGEGLALWPMIMTFAVVLGLVYLSLHYCAKVLSHERMLRAA